MQVRRPARSKQLKLPFDSCARLGALPWRRLHARSPLRSFGHRFRPVGKDTLRGLLEESAVAAVEVMASHL